MDKWIVRGKKSASDASNPVRSEIIPPDSDIFTETSVENSEPTTGLPISTSSPDRGDDLEFESVSASSAAKRPKIDSDSGSGNTRNQQFRHEWTTRHPWLENKNNKAFCKWCLKSMANNITNLDRHEKSDAHLKNMIALRSQPKLSTDVENVAFKKKIDQVKIAELRILMFLLQFNLPFILIEPLMQLIRSVASDSAIAKDLGYGKGKAQYTTINLLMEEGISQISKVLQTSKFSLIIDETTDIGTTKCLALVVRYFDQTRGKVRDSFLCMLELTSCGAKDIHEAITDFFSKYSIPLCNMIGFASDNAAVMTGSTGGVRTILKSANPHLFVIGCVCHSLQLCSSAAVKCLPAHLEQMARNIYSYFAHSTKRVNELKELQELLNTKTHKILRTSSTRWLALGNVVNRILEQWSVLRHYFIVSEVETKDDLGKRIYASLTEENEVYFAFLSYILGITNKMNLEFQAERPRIHILLTTMKQYYKTIMSNIVKREHLTDSMFDSSFVVDSSTLIEVDKIYLGPKVAVLLQKNHNISLNDLKTIKQNCRAFCVEICKQIKKRIHFDDRTLIALQILNPTALGESMFPLTSIFPNISQTNEFEIEEQWREFLNQHQVSTSLDLESFWHNVFQLKNACNETMFPKLKTFIEPLLALPHSSANTERIFSQLFLIKNKQRNRLKTNTINAIMTAKEMLDGSDSFKWMPSPDLIAKYNKSTQK